MMSSKSADLNKRHELAIMRGCPNAGVHGQVGRVTKFIRIFVSLRMITSKEGQ